jgi:hypothetical protein
MSHHGKRTGSGNARPSLNRPCAGGDLLRAVPLGGCSPLTGRTLPSPNSRVKRDCPSTTRWGSRAHPRSPLFAEKPTPSGARVPVRGVVARIQDAGQARPGRRPDGCVPFPSHPSPPPAIQARRTRVPGQAARARQHPPPPGGRSGQACGAMGRAHMREVGGGGGFSDAGEGGVSATLRDFRATRGRPLPGESGGGVPDRRLDEHDT